MRLEIIENPILKFIDFKINSLSAPIQVTSSKLLKDEDLEKFVQVIKITTELDIKDPVLNPLSKTVRFTLNSPKEFDILSSVPIRISTQQITFSMIKDSSLVYILDANPLELVLGSYDVYLSKDFDDLHVIDEELVEFEVENLPYKLKGKQALCAKFNKGLTLAYELNQTGVSIERISNSLKSVSGEPFQIFPLDQVTGFISMKSMQTKITLLSNHLTLISDNLGSQINNVAILETKPIGETVKTEPPIQTTTSLTNLTPAQEMFLKSVKEKPTPIQPKQEIKSPAKPACNSVTTPPSSQKEETPVSPQPTTTTQTTTQDLSALTTVEYKNDKNIVTTKVAKSTTGKDLLKLLIGYKVNFLTIRLRIAYIELDKPSHKRILSETKLMTKDGLKLKFEDYDNEIPYITGYLFPIKENLPLLEVHSAVDKIIPNGIHKIDIEKKCYVVSFSSLDDKNQLLNAKAIEIGQSKSKEVSTLVWVFDSLDAVRNMGYRTLNISDLSKSLLESTHKDFLSKFRNEFNVVISLEKHGSQSSIMISSPLSNINDAYQHLKSKLDRDFKETVYAFKLETEFKANMFRETIKSVFKNSSTIKLVWNETTNNNNSSKKINVTVCGPTKDVEKANQQIREIVIEDIEKPPKELVLVPDSIKKQFSISIHLEKQIMTICGAKSHISNFILWIQSSLRKESKVEIEMTEAELYFFEKTIKNDFHDMVVTETKNGLILNGEEKKVKETSSLVQSLKKNIEVINFSKSIVSSLINDIGPFLEGYFKDDLVYTHFTKPGNSKKRRNKIKISTSNFSSSESSGEDTSSDEYSDDEENFKEEYSSIQFDMYIHRAQNYSNMKNKVKGLAEMIEGRAREIHSIGFEEQRFILKHFGDKFGHRIQLFRRKKMIVIQGLWSQDVSNLLHDIQIKRESFLLVEKQIIGGEDYIFNYLIFNTKMLLRIQDLFGIKIKYDRSDKSINHKGKYSDIKKSKSYIKETIKSIKTETFDVKHLMLSVNDLGELRTNLFNKFEVDMTYNDDHIIIVGLTSVNWDDISQMIGILKPHESIWPAIDQDPINEPIEFPEGFLNDINIVNIQYVKNEKRYKFFTRSQLDIDNAIDGLNQFLKDSNKLQFNIRIDIRSTFHWKLVSRIHFDQFKSLESKHSNVKIQLKEKSIQFIGADDLVMLAYQELYEWYNTVINNAKVAKYSVPNPIATELLNPTYYSYFFDKYQIFIQQDQGSNETLCSMQVDYTKIEVNRGDILLETSVDCIVNAANSQMNHYGGIASHISDAAGPEFKILCNEYVKKNGPVPTGSAIATKPGRLDVKLVINAVAPIWNDNSKESVELCKSQLTSAVRTSLHLAKEHKCLSVAIPAIGSGIYGIPKSIAATIIIDTMLTFIKSNPRCIQKIVLCDKDEEALKQFQEILHSNTRQNSNNLISKPTSMFTSIFNYMFGNSEKLENNTPVKQVPENSTLEKNTGIEKSKSEFKYEHKLFEVAYQWKWQENDGRFINFDADQNYQIEVAFLKGIKSLEVQGDLNMQKNGHRYLIDLVSMTEMNTHYKRNARAIKRFNMNILNTNWYYVDSGKDIPIFESNNQIDLAIATGYNVNFGDKTINGINKTVTILTNRKEIGTFPLKQKTYEDRFKEYQEATKPKQINLEVSNEPEPEIETEPTINILLFSPNDEIAKRSIEYLKLEIESKFYDRRPVKFNLDQVTKLKKEFEIISKSHHCQMKVTNDGIELFGPTQYTINAENKMMKLIFATVSDQGIKFPWGTNTNNKNLELVNLLKGSPEWNIVDAKFKETLPRATIQKIEKIQNNLLWEKYQTRKDQLLRKINPSMKQEDKDKYEMMLFHGTRNNKPELIYNDEDGFDTRFSAVGMWGKATYFAVNSSYSNAYAHLNILTKDNRNSTGYGNKIKQMFLANVFIGDVVHIMPNQSFNKPPMKNSNKEYSEYYDSISGVTEGSYVYMIYENNRAYPKYLISYKDVR